MLTDQLIWRQVPWPGSECVRRRWMWLRTCLNLFIWWISIFDANSCNLWAVFICNFVFRACLFGGITYVLRYKRKIRFVTNCESCSRRWPDVARRPWCLFVLISQEFQKQTVFFFRVWLNLSSLPIREKMLNFLLTFEYFFLSPLQIEIKIEINRDAFNFFR